MNKTEQPQIFSSTGSLGVTRRQDHRVYINPRVYSQAPEDTRTLHRLAGVVDRNPTRVTRGVFRGAISDEVFGEINKNGLHDRLEVALPLSEFTGLDDNSWLVYWAHNHESRIQITPTEQMIEDTSARNYRESHQSSLERIRGVKNRGYRFVDTITSDQIYQVQSLWGSTFGWSHAEVEALQTRLEEDSQKKPEDRTVWFSAIRDNGTIVSLATAERLSIPGPTGDIDLVESTEWRTKDEYAGQGLMTATLTMLNAHVLSDLKERSRLPIIYAECNFQSRSDRAGHGAGFVIPDRSFAPQIIKQNVRVGDGLCIPESELRDFTYMYVSNDSIRDHYDPIQRDALLQEGLL